MIPAAIVEVAKAVATREGLPASRLLAIVEVETGGRATEPYDGRTPTLLPEPCWFYKRLPDGKRADALKSGLAMTSGRPDYTAFASTSQERVERFQAMRAVDETAAYESCSWGLPQILGVNAASVGYASAREMVEAFQARGVDEQIEALVRFLDHAGLRPAVLSGDMVALAKGYNGPRQADNDYAGKLARADAAWHARLATGETDFEPDPGMLQLGDQGEAVESLQRTLCALGYVVRVDGDFGPSTQVQVMGFQGQHGIQVDGKVGPETRAKMLAATPRPAGTRALVTMRSVARNTAIGAKARWGKMAAVGAGLFQVAKAGGVTPDGLIDKVQSAIDTASKAKSTYSAAVVVIAPATQAPGGLASVAIATATSPGAVGAVGACVVVWCLFHAIQQNRTADEVSGRTV